MVPFFVACTDPMTDSENTDGNGTPAETWNPEDVETYKYSENVISSRKYLVMVNGVRDRKSVV